ncbi:hypothetical protein NDA18_004622 [Ustilago nuda]|nr:hypothetical protein NDA18_004622 [Ustilago nuda]
MTATSSCAPRREVRVAIVGSGLTGLVATYLLSSYKPDSPDAPRISVEIFERASTVGMDSASITVALPLAPSESTTTTSSPSHTTTTHDDGGLRSRSQKWPKLEVDATPTPASCEEAESKSPQSLLRIDVPMRAFTGGYYPQLLALYRHLGIKTKKTNFTYSFATLPPPSTSTVAGPPSASLCATEQEKLGWKGRIAEKAAVTPSPNIIYNGANGLGGVSLPSWLRNPNLPSPMTMTAILTHLSKMRCYFASLLTLIFGYLQLLLIALWHHSLGHTSDPTHPLRSYTLLQLVADPFPPRPTPRRFSLGDTSERIVELVLGKILHLNPTFAQQTLTPLFSAVMTCTLGSVWQCPATEVLDYVALTLGKDHFVVKDGVSQVVAALLTHLGPFPDGIEGAGAVWTNAAVRDVYYRDGKAYLSVIHHGSSGTSLTLSHSTFERAIIDVASNLGRQKLFCFSRTHQGVETAGGRKVILGPLQRRERGNVGLWVCGSFAVGIPLLEGCVVSATLVADEIARLEEITLPVHARW